MISRYPEGGALVLIKVEDLITQMERQIENLRRSAEQDDVTRAKEAALIIESYCQLITANAGEVKKQEMPASYVVQQPLPTLTPPKQQPIAPTTGNDDGDDKRNLLDF